MLSENLYEQHNHTDICIPKRLSNEVSLYSAIQYYVNRLFDELAIFLLAELLSRCTQAL